MTQTDAKKIAVEVFNLQKEDEARRMQETQEFECPIGLKEEDILSREDTQTLKDFCADLREYKKVKRSLIIKIVVYGAIGGIVLMLGDKGNAIFKLFGIDKLFN